MDSIGDYLYIIMIAIAVLSGIFKNFQKKQVRNFEPVPNEEADEDSDEVFEDIFTEDDEIPVPTPNTIVERQSNMEKNNYQTAFTSLEGMFNYDNTKDSSNLKAKKEVTSAKKTKTEEPIERESINITFNLSNNEEARAAFIASEIFNRKY